MTTPTPDSLRGTLGIGADGAFRIRFERVLAHTPERVWEWITDPERLVLWLPGCTIDPRVGGAVSFDFGDEGAATGVVSEALPPGSKGCSCTPGAGRASPTRWSAGLWKPCPGDPAHARAR